MLALLALLTVASADPLSLNIDASGTSVYALVYKTGAASAAAHDHVVEARQIAGTATWDPDDPAACSISVDVGVTGLFPDADAMREALGLPKRLSDSQRDEILSHLLAEYQLFADEYDSIAFRSTSVSATTGDVEVSGDFTLRGVTKSVTVPMTVTEDGDGLRARGRFRILQSDFGYKPYKALFGALRNKDEVDIVLDIRLQPE